jgi:hypothetical protein
MCDPFSFAVVSQVRHTPSIACGEGETHETGDYETAGVDGTKQIPTRAEQDEIRTGAKSQGIDDLDHAPGMYSLREPWRCRRF